MLGWKFGLERMRRLCSLLGFPQNQFASIHVVGTNGKTSVARMISALLEANGRSTGAYTSPHIHSWRERILIRGEPISPDAFNEAVGRAEEAAQVADRSAGDEEGPVTQYELLTAAAFLAFATARIEYGVIESGLGGRLDATNVIPSRLTILTSVGLDHTEYLGETLEEIAAEKLAVLRDHSTLVTGRYPDEVEPVVSRELERRHASAVAAADAPAFPARNEALARKAVAELAGEAAADAPLEAEVPGRAQRIAGDPPVVIDVAHNPDGARALAQILDRETVCCLAILEDKDAAGIIEALAPAVAHFVCTQVPPRLIEGTGRPGAQPHPAAVLAELCGKAGAEAEAVPDPGAAWERARSLARERGAVALAAGSHYLLRAIWTKEPAENS